MAISHAGTARQLDVAQGQVAHALVADLAIEDGADEHLARVRLERVEVDVPAAQAGPVAGERRQPVGVDEDAAALHLGDEPDDPRQATVGAGHGDDVVDSSDRRAAGIEQRQPHHAEGVDQLPGHRPEAIAPNRRAA